MKCSVLFFLSTLLKEKTQRNEIKRIDIKVAAIWNEDKVQCWEWEDTLRTSRQTDPQSTRQVYLIICTGEAAVSFSYTATERSNTHQDRELFPQAVQMDILMITNAQRTLFFTWLFYTPHKPITLQSIFKNVLNKSNQICIYLIANRVKNSNMVKHYSSLK